MLIVINIAHLENVARNFSSPFLTGGAGGKLTIDGTGAATGLSAL